MDYRKIADKDDFLKMFFAYPPNSKKYNQIYEIDLINDYSNSLFSPLETSYIFRDIETMDIIYMNNKIEKVFEMEDQERTYEGSSFEAMSDHYIDHLHSCFSNILFFLKDKEKYDYSFSYMYRLKEYNGETGLYLNQDMIYKNPKDGKDYYLTINRNMKKYSVLSFTYLSISNNKTNKTIRINPTLDLKQKVIKPLEFSSREMNILNLLAKGYSSKEIANELFISTETVKSHKKNIFIKTNSKNSLGALVECLKESII